MPCCSTSPATFPAEAAADDIEQEVPDGDEYLSETGQQRHPVAAN